MRVDPERRTRRCLTDDEVVAVATMAKRAEKHYGCPQDIEWAFDADLPPGEGLLLLQSRPETVHSSPAATTTPQHSQHRLGPGLGPPLGHHRIPHEQEPLMTAAPTQPVTAPMKSFPKPSQLTVPEGAEGWEKLYPYNLVFQNLSGAEDEKFWFCDSQHWPTVFKPFETIGGEFAVKCLGQYNTRHLLIPPANGIEFKIHLGYLYMSPVGVPPEQVAARVPEFERRAGHYFQNWDCLLEQWKIKVRATIDEMEALTFESLPDMVPFEDIVTGKAKDGSEVLMENYDRLIQLCYQNWQYHFEFLNLGYLAYLDFFGFCKEVFPGIPDLAIAKMVQGVDMELFRPDDELKKLAMLAVELGLAGRLRRHRRRRGHAGPHRRRGRRDRVGGAVRGRAGPVVQLHRRQRLLRPRQVLAGAPGDPARLHQGLHPPAGRGPARSCVRSTSSSPRRTGSSRSTATSSTSEQRAAFDAKRGLAATAYPYVENHNFYIEHWTMGVFWRKVRELGQVFVDAGFWADRPTCSTSPAARSATRSSTCVTGWAVGADATGPHYWPAEIERRRGIIDALSTARPQPALNTPPAEITEPFTMMLYGITTEQVQQWLADGEEGHDGSITGMAASPGVVEGIARVVHSADQLGEVQEGDILVATITAPSWGPIFGKIKATVTDIGGMMSHAAIVCREYGLPAVTGTGNGVHDHPDRPARPGRRQHRPRRDPGLT